MTDTPETETTTKEDKVLPVRFLAPFGFIDDYGDNWYWTTGAVVHNPYIISLIKARFAPVEDIVKE